VCSTDTTYLEATDFETDVHHGTWWRSKRILMNVDKKKKDTCWKRGRTQKKTQGPLLALLFSLLTSERSERRPIQTVSWGDSEHHSFSFSSFLSLSLSLARLFSLFSHSSSYNLTFHSLTHHFRRHSLRSPVEGKITSRIIAPDECILTDSSW
jgi:hypothetical protein